MAGNVTISTNNGIVAFLQKQATLIGEPFILTELVYYKYANLDLPFSPNDPGLFYTFRGTQPTTTLAVRFFNLLDEYSAPLYATVVIPVSGANIDCIDVRDKGAKGDGFTDDTAAVQAALDQAFANVNPVGQSVTSPAGMLQKGGNATTSTSLVFTFPKPVTAGSTIVVGADCFHFNGQPTIADNLGNTYIPITQVINGQHITIGWYANNANPGSTSITISDTSPHSNSFLIAVYHEFAGILVGGPLDGKAGNANGTSGSYNAGTVNTTNANDLLFTFCYDSVLTPPPGYTAGGTATIFAATAQQYAAGAFTVLNAIGSYPNVWKTQGTAIGFAVALKLATTVVVTKGPTTVCIPSGVNCIVGNNPAAYALIVNSGVTIKLDGSLSLQSGLGLIASSPPVTHDITITGSGILNGNSSNIAQTYPLINLAGYNYIISGTLTIKNWGGFVGSTIYPGLGIRIQLLIANTNTTVDSVTFSSVGDVLDVKGAVVPSSPDTLANVTFSNGLTISNCVAPDVANTGITLKDIQGFVLYNNRFTKTVLGNTPLVNGGISIIDCKTGVVNTNQMIGFNSTLSIPQSGAGIYLSQDAYGVSNLQIIRCTCNNNNYGIWGHGVTAAWQGIEVGFDLCLNNRACGIYFDLVANSQLYIHDDTASGNGVCQIFPAPSDVQSAVASNSLTAGEVAGITINNVYVFGNVSTIGGVTTNVSSFGFVEVHTTNFALAQYQQGYLLACSNGLTATLPNLPVDFACCLNNEGLTPILLQPSGALLIDGQPSLTLQPQEGVVLYYSGTAWYSVRAVGTNRPIYIVSAIAGMPSAGQLVMIYTVAEPITIPANFASPTSRGSVPSTNYPTGSATYTVYKSVSPYTTLVQIGTIVINTSGVFTFTTTGGVAIPLNTTDRITIVAPAIQDVTLANVGITVAATRT